MRTLSIIVFRDGRPGHEKQTRGIVKALKRYVSVEECAFRVRHNRLAAEIGTYLGFLLQTSRSPCAGFSPDLIIGTGSRTHIPSLNCKRVSNARAVVCMAPSGWLRKQFDLCFVPEHDRLAPAENIFSTVGPPTAMTNKCNHNADRGLILVGGEDPGSHVWEDDALMQNVEELVDRAAIQTWIISSSPRTPATTVEKLEKLAAENSRVVFFPFSTTPEGWVKQQYHENKIVWITADSISMVYEALSAGCSVGMLPVRWKKTGGKFQYSERYLVDRGRVVSFSDWRTGKAKWADKQPLREADRCAREILKRWWPESLQ